MILFLSVAMLLAGCDKDNAPVAVSEVTLSRTALTMTVGDTEKLTATVLPEHAGYDGLVWSSNNTSVALVDVEGLVTAVSAGNATITATVGGKQVTCEVTVADAVPEGFTVTTYEALLEALRMGGASADVPTLIMLGSDITIPAGGDRTNPPINGSGYFKIDGGGHTLVRENESYYFLGNINADDDAVHIELTNIQLAQGANSFLSMIYVCNGRITLGKGVALNGQHMIAAVGEKAALELGDGCELSYAAGSSPCCVSVWYGATLVLNGGKTAAGTYIRLSNDIFPAVSYPLISVPKALTGDVHLCFTLNGISAIAQGADGYQLTQADYDRLTVNPESSWVSLYGETMKQYNDDIFELYLDPTTNYQIKLRLKNFTPPASGNIDMTSMTADEAQLTIRAALAAGFTELKLTGELSKIGMGGSWGTFINNKQITKCDLTGVTDWGTPTLPNAAFANCTALQEVMLPDDMKTIGSSVFSGCSALITVNLSQVTRINLSAFWGCTSLETLALDNVTAIGQEAFYGCTGLETLKIPKCTEFGNYIVTGCRSLTRIEATVAGNFVDISDGRSSIEHTAVFHNKDTHSGENVFAPARCDLVLNTDKQEDGTAVPKVSGNNRWTLAANASPMMWKSITFRQ